MKKCPFCAEDIQEEAIKCKHCGSMFTQSTELQQTKSPVLINESQEKVLAVIAHLGGLIPVCFLSLLVPFAIWLIKGNESAFVERQSKEALNFQLSLVIYAAAAILVAFTIIGIPITIACFIFFWITNLICSIKGAIRTSKGITYSYPFNLRLIK